MTTLDAVRKIDLTPMVSPTGKPLNIRDELVVPENMAVMAGEQEPAEHHGVFRILNPRSGDDRLTWDKRDFQATKEARRTFLELIQKGFKPFRVGPNGRRSNEAMQEFDPTAQQVLFVPMAPVAGG